MVAQDPQLAGLGDDSSRFKIGDRPFRHIAGGWNPRVQDHVDLRQFKAGQLNVEAKIDEVLKFNGQNFRRPTSFLCELIVGNHIGALIPFAHVLEAKCRDGFVAEQLCSFHAAMTGYELVVSIDQDRIVESKPLDRSSNFLDLPC